MNDKSIQETLDAIAIDIDVMNKVLQLAYDNVHQGLHLIEQQQAELACVKINEICSILEMTTQHFNKTLAMHRLNNTRLAS